MITKIFVKYTFEGFHRWPGATGFRSYLADRHRHIFHVAASIEVFDDDREIEFHDFLRYCRAQTPGGELGSRSCEMIARDLLGNINARYPGRQAFVKVSEDGEVGAYVSN